MKLLLRRDQKKGMLSSSVTFSLDARAQLTPEEADWVRQYRMGKTVLYSKHELADKGFGLLGAASRLAFKMMNISLTVDELINGKHFECKDIIEMRALEEQVKEACLNFKEMLQTAGRFGGEEVLEF